MVDNIGYTPGTGASVAADEIGGILFQRVKATWGADGAANDVSAAAPMPVSDQAPAFLFPVQTLVTSASSYTTGKGIGGLITFTGVTSANDVTALLQSVLLQSKVAITSAVDLVLFSASPASSTVTDNATYALATADFDKVIDVIHITDWTAHNTASSARAQRGEPFAPAAGTTTIYGVLVARGAVTCTGTADIKATLTTQPVR